MSGVARIAKERNRQIQQENWTPGHDDEHDDGSLSAAAACYAQFAAMQIKYGVAHINEDVPSGWPWENSWWKPSPDPIRNLEKSGALDAAEIDRMERLERKPNV